MQRRLTREELRHANRAAWYLRSVMNQCGLIANGGSVLDYLWAMEAYGTTDGKPYDEPQPEIGEGYRLATEADVSRSNVEYFSHIQGDKWVRRVRPEPLLPGYTYRVPVDRIPTDEDAKQRPTVMVASNPAGEWHARPLLAVVDSGFVVASGDGATTWKHCRFPCPGELP